MQMLSAVLLLYLSGITVLAQEAEPAPTAEQLPVLHAENTGDSIVGAPPVLPVIANAVTKNKPLYQNTGFVQPFLQMPSYALSDQRSIWTSPFHMNRKEAKWWVLFGGTTGILIATDKFATKQLPNSQSQVSTGKSLSQIGSGYALIPVSASFYLVGSLLHENRSRETGLLAFETLIDTGLVVEALKIASDRARPYENNGTGRFENNPGGRLSSGFPSGHSIAASGLASIVAHEYPRPLIVPILAYALASAVAVGRVEAREHFPADVVAGSAMGWFIGDFVYRRAHRGEPGHTAGALRTSAGRDLFRKLLSSF